MKTISEATLMAANLRGLQVQTQFPIAVAARYDRRIARVVVTLSSGLLIAFTSRSAQGLERALPSELTDVEVTPSGLGLHFPRLDADVYLPALLEGYLGTKYWMANRNGRSTTKVTSEAKALAARENGKLGGRPRRKNLPPETSAPVVPPEDASGTQPQDAAP